MTTVAVETTPDRRMPDPQDFLQHLRGVARASELTVGAYAGDIRHFMAWLQTAVGNPGPEHLTRPLLFRYLSSLEGLSPNTIRRRMHALGSWFGYLIECEVLKLNPTQRLPLPRRERSTPQVPTPDQASQLLAAAVTPVERATIWLLVTTGLRRAELANLDLADLKANGTELRILGKGNRERLVPLPAQCQEVLHSYLSARGPDAGPLLLNRAGKRLGLTSLRRIFTRLLRRAGLTQEGFTLHSMRHSYATMLVRAGVDLGVIRDLLGHSDLAVTSIYLHSDLRSKRVAVEQLPVLTIGGGDDE
ncbi:MAG: tyrosine-type recombinase/integrase [Armatimonadota bacterium]